ncbi:hypothetical protein [Delftia sp. PS-11]|uniref:hypothetical protein n=1 Tax=Delftia sp. PS-11 TaxID=2767222 RepID=UPI00245418FD|nr:hypothetical protein [Delftia sp. PS-11]KAJ8743656.1 hypothetical protein H9T68_15780 [Delftia sp. PS-11]
MKTTATPPLLALRITELTDCADIDVIVTAPSGLFGVPWVIVKSGARAWSFGLAVVGDDIVATLADMGAARILQSLEYSRRTGRHETPPSDIAEAIPPAVRAYLESLKP